MNFSIHGDSDKKRLNDSATYVYLLDPSEYKIIPREGGGTQFELFVMTDKVIEPSITINVSKDALSVSINLYPGINTDHRFEPHKVKDFLKNSSILEEFIKDEKIIEACKLLDKKDIVLNFTVAAGVPPINGNDGVVEYIFETQGRNPPKRLADGRVDYKTVTSFIIVSANDLLVRRTPPTEGRGGKDVHGETLSATPGNDKTIEAGEGVAVNETNTEYKAKYNGQVICSGNIISVLPVLEIRGDVDMRVGNVLFEGAVHVSGNVLPGFNVTAETIFVDGIVENADLTAKTSICVKTGRKGVGKGTIKSGGDVVIGYCENGDIFSGGLVEIQKYCFNSTVYAERIYTSSKDSLLSGGFLQAFSEIRSANIGSNGTNEMTVFVGVSPTTEERAKKVQKEIDSINESLQKISDIIKKVDTTNAEVLKDPKFRKLLDTVTLFNKRLPLLKKKYDELMQKAVCADPKIIVENSIKAGVKVRIGTFQIMLKNDMSRVEFFLDKEGHDIGFKNI